MSDNNKNTNNKNSFKEKLKNSKVNRAAVISSVMLVAALMINASPWMMAFAPAAAVGGVICVYHTCTREHGRGLQLLLAGLMAVFAVLSLRGDIAADNAMVIISMVVSFYFGTQHERGAKT